MGQYRTHNYPATRKPRTVAYSKSYKLIMTVGEEKLKEYFSKAGQYTVAKQLSEYLKFYVSPNVVHYCRKRYNLGKCNE